MKKAFLSMFQIINGYINGSDNIRNRAETDISNTNVAEKY